MPYDRKDYYYKKAKSEGKASRAAYKLLQLQEKFKFLKAGSKVVDLGCTPGGWLQELSQIIGPQGKVVGIDILPLKINLPPNCTFLNESIEDETTVLHIKESLNGEANAVVSDMSPNLSGVQFADAYKSYELANLGFELCLDILTPGGTYVCKIFPGQEVQDFRKVLQQNFAKVSTFTPPSTRKTSTEIYLVCLNFCKAI